MASECPICGRQEMIKPSFLNNLLAFDVQQRLRDGRYVTKTEDVQLSTYIAVSADGIQHYDTEITRLRTHIDALIGQCDSLTQERDDLKKRQLSLQSLRSPIRRIPHDVLVEIFSHLTRGRPLSFDGKRICIPLLRASHVNSHWRNVVHSTKSFWREVDILGKVALASSPALRWMLEQSGNTTLSIRFPTKLGARGITPLLKTSRRWGSVRIIVEQKEDIKLYRSIQDNLPLLESLELQTKCSSDISIFRNAPSLTELKLRFWDWNVSPTGNFNWPELPWHQLTKLTLSTLKPARLHELLPQCINLTFLKLNSYSLSQTPESLVTCPKLQTLFLILGVSNDREKELASLFQMMNLPSLARMTISVSGSITLPIVEFQEMQARSQFPLSEFKLESRNASIKNLPIFLGLLPSLRCLGVQERSSDRDLEHGTSRNVENDFLKCLTVHNSSSKDAGNGETPEYVLLPSLEDISLMTRRPIDHHLLTQVLASRWQGNISIPSIDAPTGRVSLLKKVVLGLGHDTKEALFQSLHDLRASGKDLRIVEMPVLGRNIDDW